MATAQKVSKLDLLDTLAEHSHGLGVTSVLARTVGEDDVGDHPQLDEVDAWLAEMDDAGLIKGHESNQHYLTEEGLTALDNGEIPTPDDSGEDTGEPESDLEALAQEVPDDLDADEVVNYTSEKNGQTYKYKPGTRRVSKDKADEEMEVDYHFPPQGETRTLKRFLTDGEACPHKRRIISEDAIADGFADDPSEFKKRAIRLVCPHCERAVGADINDNGVVRIATHVLPEGETSAPTVGHFVFEGDDDSPLGEDWTFVDPSDE